MDVIDPTVETLREAIATYESQGGTAGIIMNDDGMQIMSEDDRQIRQHYYARNNIGWIARPGHNQAGFRKQQSCDACASDANMTSTSRSVQEGQ